MKTSQTISASSSASGYSPEYLSAQIAYASLNYFKLPEELESEFTYLEITQVKTYKFLDSLDLCTVLWNSQRFIPLYRKGASKGRILKLPYITLSFRIPRPEYNLPAIVLVSASTKPTASAGHD
jgi:hypothetical protein